MQKKRRLKKMVRESIIEELSQELQKEWVSDQLDKIAAHVIALGYRRRTNGSWIYDNSYEGRNKDIFVCSVCGHWQSSKKRSDNIFYMNYCPFCGARMDRPDTDRAIEIQKR